MLENVNIDVKQLAVQSLFSGAVTVDSESIIKASGMGSVTILVEGLIPINSSDEPQRAVLNVYGTVINENGYYAISGSGMVKDKEFKYTGTDINVFENALIIAKSGHAIYHPQIYGKLNITGGMIKGKTAIEIRAGELNISGLKTQILGGSDIPEGADFGGIYGAGIAVAPHVLKLPITVNIADAAVKGHYALYQVNLHKNDNDYIKNIKINIKSGTFTLVASNSVSENSSVIFAEDICGFIKEH